jgi:hypothetical protein
MRPGRGCLDGPLLAAYLDETRADLSCLSDAERRALQRWRDGHQARIDTVDRLLIQLGLNLGGLPEEFMCPYRNGRHGLRKAAA